MRRATIIATLAGITLAPPTVRAVQSYEGGHEAEWGDYMEVHSRIPGIDPVVMPGNDEPHCEVDIGAQVHGDNLYGAPNDLRRWARLLEDCATALETP